MRNGSLPWKPALRLAADDLQARLNEVDPDAFARALDREVRARLGRLLGAVERYRRHPYRRALADPPTLWQAGSTRLLDFGALAPEAVGAPAVLFVPSLVNRGYILDLAEGTSFLRWLARQGLRPLLIEWGAPGPAERGFDLSDYIVGRLEAALDHALAHCGAPVALAGYCMGGNLALAAAQRRPKDVSALALLATPWDFHADRPELAHAVSAACEPALALAKRLGILPTDFLQSLFYLLDPYLAPRKFLRFADMAPGSPRELAFVALEDWLNDGVPLVAGVARECLVDWYGLNKPGRGDWHVAGQAVDPGSLRMPTLVMVPAQDRIVPPASAEALGALIPEADVRHPAAGHIGMMVSGVAKSAVWEPLRDWLRATAVEARARKRRRPARTRHSAGVRGTA